MKTLKKYLAGTIMTGLLFSAISCSKTFYSKVNNNPNAPASALPNVLLTPVEVSLGYAQGGDMSRFASMFDQQTTGVARQSSAYEQYIFTNQDPEDLWDNMYTGMEDNYNLIKTCGSNYNAYKGIGEVLMAYSLQIMSDCWGSIPYTQAFQGSANTKPTYDKDVTNYATIISLCNQAISDLNNTANDFLAPGSDDIIYNGSTAEWAEFANAVKARIYLHQSQTGGGSTVMADSALACAMRSFQSNADNAQVFFGNASTNNAPNYQFYTQRGDISYAFADGSFSSDGFFFGMLSTLNDPRKYILIDSADESQFNYLNAYFQEANSPVDLICSDEIAFIEAEAIIRSGGSVATAQTAYQSGISLNMDKLGGPDSKVATGLTITTAQLTTYMAANGTLPTTTNDALNQIYIQKYIALYMNPESWTDWRRSTKLSGYPNGSPALTPVAGPFQSNGIPRRFLYPQSELNLNGANTPSATQWTPRDFWDN